MSFHTQYKKFYIHRRDRKRVKRDDKNIDLSKFNLTCTYGMEIFDIPNVNKDIRNNFRPLR